MPNEQFAYMNTSEEAWNYALQCKAWIWKHIKSRNIPESDQEDLFQSCLIEIQRLMVRYNSDYSLIAWARFGILKAFKKYDCSSGLIKLPTHIIEKMHKLYVRKIEAEQEGKILTQDEMVEITGMKILDILTAQEKFNRPNPPEDDLNYFMEIHPDKCDVAHFMMLNGERKSIIENVSSSSMLDSVYEKLNILEDMEIFVLVYRFGLDFSRIPQRPVFFYKYSYLYLAKKPGDYNLQEIASFLGLSKERIRQIESSGISKIKKPPRRRQKSRRL